MLAARNITRDETCLAVDGSLADTHVENGWIFADQPASKRTQGGQNLSLLKEFNERTSLFVTINQPKGCRGQSLQPKSR